MRWLACVTVVLAAVSVSAASPGKPPVLSRMTIRAYDGFGVSAKTLEDAERTGSEILSDAGVESAWRNCRMRSGPASSSPDSCSDPLADHEVIMRIVRAPEGKIDSNDVFGYSLVNTESRRGTLATVFGDRINTAANRVRLPQGTLLARAMAHELGHLLLGTSEHSSEGLMRAIWPDRSLLSRDDTDWRFSTMDLARLRVAFSLQSPAGRSSLH